MNWHNSTMCSPTLIFISFFFNDTATTEIYTLSLHDALPILLFLRQIAEGSEKTHRWPHGLHLRRVHRPLQRHHRGRGREGRRSEEHTSELQSHSDIVCRLLLEKRNQWIDLHNGTICVPNFRL